MSLTKPGDVFVLPGAGAAVGPLGVAPARCPPEGVDVGAHVEIGTAQQPQPPKGLLGWGDMLTGHLGSPELTWGQPAPPRSPSGRYM